VPQEPADWQPAFERIAADRSIHEVILSGGDPLALPDEQLAQLAARLADLRVMPYYLHQLDRVAGTAHFEVPEATGIRLIEQLRARLPGYAVPRYVRETPGAVRKTLFA